MRKLKINFKKTLPEDVVENFDKSFLILEEEFINPVFIKKIQIFFKENNINKLNIIKFEVFNEFNELVKTEKLNQEISVDEFHFFFSKEYDNGLDIITMIDNIVIIDELWGFALLYFKRDDIVLVFVNSERYIESFSKIVLPYENISFIEKVNYYFNMFSDKEKGRIYLTKLINNYFDSESIKFIK